MAKYYVQVFHRTWNQLIVEADSKSEARKLAALGEGEQVDWGICNYNVSAPSKATPLDEEMEAQSE